MKISRIATLALAAVLSVAASKPNWTATVTVGADGTHTLGNPDAPVKLTEFVSYTCPHCGAFEKDAEGPLRLAYVMPGKVSVRIQHVLRDPVDVTVAMLTNCGKPAGFFKRHHTFMHDQDKWLARLGGMSTAQRQRWATGPIPARLQAITRDFGFYATMERLGYARPAVDRCLGDTGMLDKLTAQAAGAAGLGVRSTPSFSLNGDLLETAHSWETLLPQIAARLNRPAPKS